MVSDGFACRLKQYWCRNNNALSGPAFVDFQHRSIRQLKAVLQLISVFCQIGWVIGR